MRSRPIALFALSLGLVAFAGPAWARGTNLKCANPPFKTAAQCFQTGTAELKQAGCRISSAASAKSCGSINTGKAWYCQVLTLNCVKPAHPRTCPHGYATVALPAANVVDVGVCKAAPRAATIKH